MFSKIHLTNTMLGPTPFKESLLLTASGKQENENWLWSREFSVIQNEPGYQKIRPILPRPGELLSNRENSDCGHGKGVIRGRWAADTFSAGPLVQELWTSSNWLNDKSQILLKVLLEIRMLLCRNFSQNLFDPQHGTNYFKQRIPKHSKAEICSR